jgi:outer membrane receptor protein involved in Fe transport
VATGEAIAGQDDGDFPELVGKDESGGIMDEFAFLQEEDLVVSAALHEQKIGFSPSAVVVITRRQIEESGVTTLVDLLRLYPSVLVALFNPSHTMVYARGNYRILLMVDGREVNLDLFPVPFFELLPVGIHEIERVEIVLGPNSALYGANAVAAVINVITGTPGDGGRSEAVVAAGQNGAVLLGARAQFGSGSWSWRAAAGFDTERSFMDRDHTVRELARASLATEWNFSGGSLVLDGGLVAGEGLLFSDAMGYMPIRGIWLSHAQARLEHDHLKLRAYWYRLRADVDIELDLRHPDLGMELGSFPTMSFTGDTLQLESRYDLEPWGGNLLIAGVDVRYTYCQSKQFTEHVDEWRLGVFVHDEQSFADRLLLTVGARLDMNTRTRTAVSPQLSLVYNPAGEHYLRLSGGMAFRKPTVIESSANLHIDAHPSFPEIDTLFEDIGLSNPELRNEILTSAELAYQGAFFARRLRININGYFLYAIDTIELQTWIAFNQFMQIDLERTDLGYRNIDPENVVVGASAGVEADLAGWLSLFVRANRWREWWVRRDGWDRYRDPTVASAGAVIRLPFGLKVHLAGMYVSSLENDYLRNPDSVLGPAYLWDLPARTSLMASLAYRMDLNCWGLDLGLFVLNAFGARFREKYGVIGRDGSNFGGERVGSKAMLTARLSY